jgi:uncharacterized protein YutE (UPF0331/DUF86 family)
MTPATINPSVVADKTAVVRRMLESIETLPLANLREFLAVRHHAAAGESYLRRGLEALLDLGRHVLAKGFGVPVTEYKEIATALRDRGLLTPEMASLLIEMAGYRNRLVHFYDEVTPEELYGILTTRRQDLERVLGALLAWIATTRELSDGPAESPPRGR